MIEDVKRQIRTYLQENFLYMRRDFVLGDHASLLGEGVLDSMGVMELLQYVEETFAITVGEEDITEQNFGTLQAIASYVISQRDLVRQSA